MRVVLVFLVLLSAIYADLIVTESTKYSDGGVFESKSYYKDGYFKTASEDETMIVDLNKMSVWFLYDDKKLYFGGKVETVIDSIKGNSEMDSVPEASMPLPEDEREIVIKLVKKDIKIGKFTTDKYQVIVADELKEELFIDKTIKPNIDIKKLVEIMTKLDTSATREYEFDQKYLDLMEIGYPIRTVVYDGGVVVTEVTSVEKKALALEEFLPPVGYKKATPQEIFHID